MNWQIGPFVRTAVRSLRNRTGYAVTNVAGLSVGLAIAFLIVLYIQFELSYDGFHAKADRLYRVSVQSKERGAVTGDNPEFTPPLGPAMKAEFPEVENYARLSTLRPAYVSRTSVEALKVEGIAFVDSTLFDLFSFSLARGDARTALARPFSIVLTRDLAGRLFGGSDPVGQVVKLDNENPYTVTGVVDPPPANSQIQFEALVSFSTLYRLPDLFLDWNGGNQYITYVLLAEHTQPEAVERRFPDLMWKSINKQLSGIGVSYEPYLQPLKEVHLRYNADSASLRGDLYIFGAIALLILFIACVNFVNLAVAQAVPRSREVGIRKVLGAGRWSLIAQFLGESFLLSGIAVALALLLLELLSGAFGELTGRDLSPGSWLTVPMLGTLFGISLVVSLSSGLYPALYLSSMDAVRTLKGGTASFKRTSRNILVVLQFAISIGLVIGTIVIGRQLEFVRSKDLGFDRSNLLVLPLVGGEAQGRYGPLKSALAQLPGVVSVCASSDVPHDGFTSNGYFPQGSLSPMMIHVVDADEAFLSTYAIAMSQGRSFTGASAAEKDGYLINETLARELHWKDPVGKTIRRNGDHVVIGVVKDFHYATLHDKIEPLIITNRAWLDRFQDVSIRVRAGDMRAQLGAIREVWARVMPSSPFNYFFLDETFDRAYRREEQFRSMLGWASLVAILIASMGLLSLVTLSVRQRTKEIGIRKVLGASVAGIIGMLSREYVGLIMLANLFAWPVAAYVMNAWLENFAYRTTLPWWAFLVAGAAALVAALAAVGVQSFRAATSNPVEALRYE